MERMGDILAKAANRRATLRRVRQFDGPASNEPRSFSAPTSPRPQTPTSPNQRMSSPSTRPLDGRSTRPFDSRPTPTTPKPTPPTIAPRARVTPLSARGVEPAYKGMLPDARPAPAASATADVLDADRILELPARPQAASNDRNGPRAPRPGAGRTRSGSGMQSLGAAAQDYVARMPARRAPEASAESRDVAERRALPADVCQICGGAGYVRLDVPLGDPAFGQAVRCECKERQIASRERSTLRRLSNLDPFRKQTFETYDMSTPGTREAYEVACHYADDPMDWLVFRGGYGTGKTHLAAAIANACEQNGVPVIFAIVPDLLDHLRAAFAPNSETTYDALFDKVREVQLLVLDDLGAENSTAWATEKLFQLINYRYNYRMPTVITTNNRLLTHMDERIRSRLSDMSLVRSVTIEAQDYRERHLGRNGRNPSNPSGPRGSRGR